jgi:hypothetical protein
MTELKREKHIMILSLISAALLSSASPAAVAASEAPVEEKKICKRQKQIGSMVRQKKICRTKTEWSEAEAQARQDMGEIQRTSRAPPNG